MPELQRRQLNGTTFMNNQPLPSSPKFLSDWRTLGSGMSGALDTVIQQSTSRNRGIGIASFHAEVREKCVRFFYSTVLYNTFSSYELFLITLFLFSFIPGCTAVSNSGGVISIPTPSSPGPLTILTSTLPNGQTGTSYSANLIAQGGQAPYAWSLTTGTPSL